MNIYSLMNLRDFLYPVSLEVKNTDCCRDVKVVFIYLCFLLFPRIECSSYSLSQLRDPTMKKTDNVF